MPIVTEKAMFEIQKQISEENELLEAGKYSLNCCTLPLPAARDYSETQFANAGKDFSSTLPDFDKGYLMMQKKCRKALNIPRIQMPVIEPRDMKEFDKSLKKGKVDIFPPYAKGKFVGFVRPPSEPEGTEWVTLGYEDGSVDDDVIRAKWTKIAAKNLIPTQSQIWLEKLVGNIIRFGTPGAGSPVTQTTIIVSKEGYILDGHHRYGQCMITDVNLRLKALHIPLDIKTLLDVGRSYGLAIGNIPKA